MNTKLFFMLIITILATITACGFEIPEELTQNSKRQTENGTSKKTKEIRTGTTTTKISETVERIEHRFQNPETAKIIIFKIKPASYNITIENQPDNSKTISGWREDFPDALLIANAAYFDENNNPTGTLIHGGEKVTSGTYDSANSGTVITKPFFSIAPSNKNPLDPSLSEEALQSFPFLIKDTKVDISKDSGKESRRTFIGADTKNDLYIGFVPDYFISLYDLANELEKTNIEWQHVLNLDGGTSTGFDFKHKAHIENSNSFVSIPNVIVIQK